MSVLDFCDALVDTGANLKIVAPENMHLTLKFLGDTDEGLRPDIRDAIEECVEGIEPVELAMKGAGVFPKWSYMRVIWVGIDGAEPLVTVAERLEDALQPLGFKREKRGFKPHLTIARVRSGRKKGHLKRVVQQHEDTEFGQWRVREIRLKKSVLGKGGPTYSTVEAVPLGAPDEG